MHTYQEIEFKSVPSTSKHNADKVCCQGHSHQRALAPAVESIPNLADQYHDFGWH